MILDTLKEVEILILKKMFYLSKENSLERPSPVQGKILMYLYNNRDIEVYQKDLENVMHCSKVSLSEMLNKLENSGDIERISNDGDKRKKRIILTEKSIKKLDDFKSTLNQLEDVVLYDFTSDEKEQLDSLLKKIKNNLKENDDDKVI